MRKILLTSLAALAIATTAQAADTKGFYVGIAGGWNHTNDADLDGRPDGTTTGLSESFDEGWVGLANTGYRWSNGLRTEIEGGYRRNDVDSATGSITGSTSSTADGDYSSWSAMANVIYDLNHLYNASTSSFTPYVGAGIGVARVKLDSTINGPGFGIPLPINDTDTVLAYQGIAGLNYALNDKVDLGVSYRYFWTQDPRFNTDTGVDFDGEYNNHAILVGLTYKFR